MSLSCVDRFITLVLPLGVDIHLAGATGRDLRDRYYEEGKYFTRPKVRYHHTWELLEGMFLRLDEAAEKDDEGGVHNKSMMELAIWFHEAVYDPKSKESQNEDGSIAVWEDFAKKAGSALKHMVEPVSALIDMTKSHRLLHPPAIWPRNLSYADACLFIDLTLAHLSSSEKAYLTYSYNSRKENQHKSDRAYSSDRIDMLKEYLGRAELYVSSTVTGPAAQERIERMEVQARSNISIEIFDLGGSNRMIPWQKW